MSTERILNQLEKFRHLPAYRLEPRADAFFGCYMREVMEKCLGTSLHETITPELPLSRQALDGESTGNGEEPKLVENRNLSVKVDYALYSEKDKTVYLIELKTDIGSKREEQNKYLRKAKKIGFKHIVSGIRDIMKVTNSRYRKKYGHLIYALEQMGMLKVNEEFYERLFNSEEQFRVHLIDDHVELTKRAKSTKVKVLYIQPTENTKPHDAIETIDFVQFARELEKLNKNDPVALQFANSLKHWREAAGDRDPRLCS